MPPSTRTALRGRALLVDIPLGVVVGWLLFAAAQWAGWMSRGGGPDFGRGRGRPDLDDLALVAAPLPFAAIMVGGVCVRRIWPRIAVAVVGVAGVGYVGAGGAFPAALLALVLCVYVLAATRPVRQWAWVAVLVAPLALASGWGETYLGLLDVRVYANLAFGIAVTAAVALLATVRSGRREAVRQGRADELERVAGAERLRIAREVHDVVGHSLSVISMQAGVALHVLDRRPDQVRPALEAIRTTSAEAMAELRHALGVFREQDGSPTAPTPDLGRVEALVEALRAAGREVEVIIEGDVNDLPQGIQQAGFRIVQESLTNVVRHAGEARAVVRLSRVPTGLEIEVIDDGSELAAPLVDGNGLRGMRERVSAVGGTLDVRPRAEGGVGVRAVLPMGVVT